MSTPEWTLQPGQHSTRAEISGSFGGASQGGIAESAKTPTIFLFNDPAKAEANNYTFDGWLPDGMIYQYTGDGPTGDQREVGGNKAVINHKRDGRTLRLFTADGFVGSSKTVKQQYIGEFALDDHLPYIRAEQGKGESLRLVYVFRLLPRSDVLRRPQDFSPNVASDEGTSITEGTATVGDAESERHDAPTFETTGSGPRTASRIESDLVERYEASLRGQQHQVGRKVIRPQGELVTLRTDTYDRTADELYEAKGSATRNAVRLALGQLLDYSRYVQPKLRTVLLPSEPAKDLQQLLRQHQVGCVYESQPKVFVRPYELPPLD